MSLQTGNAGAPIACCTIALSDRTNWYNPIMQSSSNNPFNGNTNMNGGFNPTFNMPTFNQGGGFPNPNPNFNRPGPGPNQFGPGGPGRTGPGFNPNGPFNNPQFAG